MKILIICFLAIAPYQFVWSSGQRFLPHQLRFSLVQHESGEKIPCQHQLLHHVPWWRVSCGSRQYTVDLWFQVLVNSSEQRTRLGLMFDVSEGVASSQHKEVKFQSHFTQFEVNQLSDLKRLTSFLDVRNGQASLYVEAELN